MKTIMVGTAIMTTIIMDHHHHHLGGDHRHQVPVNRARDPNPVNPLASPARAVLAAAARMSEEDGMVVNTIIPMAHGNMAHRHRHRRHQVPVNPARDPNQVANQVNLPANLARAPAATITPTPPIKTTMMAGTASEEETDPTTNPTPPPREYAPPPSPTVD